MINQPNAVPLPDSGNRPSHDLDQVCINAIRVLAMDAVQQANSGHPGLPMGAAPMAYVLWTRYLRHNPANPSWPNRDRFVLSAGHGSMLLYSLLYLTGYDLPMDELKRFRQWGSRAPGHPEQGLTPGVETTTGPLGQGFANGVGLALAERFLAAHVNRPDYPLVDHYTYGLVSDGDLMERVSAEAAYGWQVEQVDNGNYVAALDATLQRACADEARPSLICVRTHIGYGSPHKQDTYEAHGAPLGEEEVLLTRQQLGWPLAELFHLPDEVLACFRQALVHGAAQEAAWQQQLAAYRTAYPALAEEYERVVAGDLLGGWESAIPQFAPGDGPMATRKASGKVLTALASQLWNLVGGSADLNPSTNTVLAMRGDFQRPPTSRPSAEMEPATQGAAGVQWGWGGQNVHFGVREHAMGAILNGIALHGGLIAYEATFLIFSDYMRPPMRLAALMGLGVKYVFTHDSIAVGEDGPTHQPVEHLASLRAMPGLVVIRPADANEVVWAWRVALLERDRPVALVLSRQDLPIFDRVGQGYSGAEGVARGAYVLADAPGDPSTPPDLVLIGTGSEVALCLAASEQLAASGLCTRVVSMPSWELFDEQPAEYRAAILGPVGTPRLAVEAGVSLGWHWYTGERGAVLVVKRFGTSAPGKEVLQHYGFTVDNVVTRALALLSTPSKGVVV